MANLYIEEYSGIGEQQSSVIPAPQGFNNNQDLALSSVAAVTTADFTSSTIILRLKNEGSVTCYYRLGTLAALTAAPAQTTDRAILPGTIEDIYVASDIRTGSVRLSAVTH